MNQDEIFKSTWMWHDARILYFHIQWDHIEGTISTIVRSIIYEDNYNEDFVANSLLGKTVDIIFGGVLDYKSTIPAFYSSKESIYSWDIEDIIFDGYRGDEDIKKNTILGTSGSKIEIVCENISISAV